MTSKCWVVIALAALAVSQVNGSSCINAETEKIFAHGVVSFTKVEPSALQQFLDLFQPIADRADREGNEKDAAAIRRLISTALAVAREGVGADPIPRLYQVTGIAAVARLDPAAFDYLIQQVYSLAARTHKYACAIKRDADYSVDGPIINGKSEKVFARGVYAISKADQSVWRQKENVTQAVAEKADKQGQPKEAAALRKNLAIYREIAKNGPSAHLKNNNNELSKGIAAFRAVDKDTYNSFVDTLYQLASRTHEYAKAIERVGDRDVCIREEVRGNGAE